MERIVTTTKKHIPTYQTSLSVSRGGETLNIYVLLCDIVNAILCTFNLFLTSHILYLKLHVCIFIRKTLPLYVF